MSTEKQLDPTMKGWLYKWTNYLKGYQKRFFVLENGVLSYYRNNAEMIHTCRGNISLHGASIHTEDSCNFVVSNGSTQTFHLKATTEVERQRWVTALELAKARAVRVCDSEDDEEDDVNESPRDDVTNTLRILTSKLEDLKTCHELIGKHASALQNTLAELERLDSACSDLPTKVKTVNERATLFRISSSAMINAHSEFVELSSKAGRKWVRLLHHEREQRIRLEETIEALARQHSHLEEEAKEQMSHAIPSPSQVYSEDEEENEFEDAIEEFSEEIFLPVTSSQLNRSHTDISSQRRNSTSLAVETEDYVPDNLPRRSTTPEIFYENVHSDLSLVSEQSRFLCREDSEGALDIEGSGSFSNEVDARQNSVQVIMRKEKSTLENDRLALKEDEPNHNGSDGVDKAYDEMGSDAVIQNGSLKRQRRTRVPEKPNYPINLWSILKNCIGKELSKIPMPVNFSEPLSFLQRLNEDFEYSDILNKAAQVDDSCEQLAWVAAFTVSSYATTAERTNKPFNPLLWETYECDRRDDMGWRSISEQVSHHPPIVAQHVEAADWISWQEFSMSSKFRGKYLQIIPLGIAHLEFNKTGSHYTWRKVSTTVHNLIVGKLWLDNHGEMEIINHKTKDKCCLKFIPYSYFSREIPKKVTGYVVDSHGTFKWFLTGTWDEKIEACRVTSQSMRHGKPVYETASPKVLWRRNKVELDCDRYYNFTEFACQLNEYEEAVALTDSRRRPDQRLMEIGQWDEANSEKLRLEEKQRSTRRQRELEVEEAAKEGRGLPPQEPVWFKKELDPFTSEMTYKYKGGYWESKDKQNWTICPDIF